MVGEAETRHSKEIKNLAVEVLSYKVPCLSGTRISRRCSSEYVVIRYQSQLTNIIATRWNYGLKSCITQTFTIYKNSTKMCNVEKLPSFSEFPEQYPDFQTPQSQSSARK